MSCDAVLRSRTLDTTLGRALLRVTAQQMGASFHVTRLLRCYGSCSFGRGHINMYSLLSVVRWHKHIVVKVVLFTKRLFF